MFTADQLIAHAVGDYILQSDWMALEKTKRSLAAAVHALTYTLPFLFLTSSWAVLAIIASTHFVIDRWRLARYIVWAKNWLAPWEVCDSGMRLAHESCNEKHRLHQWHRIRPNPPWSECQATGYPPDRPPWLAVWLLIIADNILHVTINALALQSGL